MNLRNRGSRLMFAPLLTSLLADTDLLFLPLTLSQILFPSNFSHVSFCSGLNDLHPSFLSGSFWGLQLCSSQLLALLVR